MNAENLDLVQHANDKRNHAKHNGTYVQLGVPHKISPLFTSHCPFFFIVSAARQVLPLFVHMAAGFLSCRGCSWLSHEQPLQDVSLRTALGSRVLEQKMSGR